MYLYYEAVVQLLILIQCYVTNNIQTTPLSKRPEVLIAELRPGSRPEIWAAKRRPGEWPGIKMHRNPLYMKDDDANNDFLFSPWNHELTLIILNDNR